MMYIPVMKWIKSLVFYLDEVKLKYFNKDYEKVGIFISYLKRKEELLRVKKTYTALLLLKLWN